MPAASKLANGDEIPHNSYDHDKVNEAIMTLQYANEPITLEGGILWHEAIICAAKRYEQKLWSKNLDSVYTDYLMQRELGLHYDTGRERLHSYRDKHRAEIAERVLIGREFKGEPKDFNY